MSDEDNILIVPRLVSSRISAKTLLEKIDETENYAIIDFSENEACSISFIQELVRIHIVLNGNMNSALVFDNIRQETVDKVDYLFKSFVNVRKRIIIKNIRES